MFQRIDQAGYKLPIDERILADCDTLLVFGLDHILSEQEASPEKSLPFVSGSSAKVLVYCSRRITMSASPAT